MIRHLQRLLCALVGCGWLALAGQSATAQQRTISVRPPVKVTGVAATVRDTAAHGGTARDTSAASTGGDPYTVSRPTALSAAPGGPGRGTLAAGAPVRVVGTDRGWVLVRTEGWVRAGDLTPADSTLAPLTAADLHADPVGARGKLVQWTVQVLALERADPLRQGMAGEEPFLLARGPGRETSLLYLVVPPGLMGTARALQPLQTVTVTARVRNGRSEPAGVPILDLQTIQRIP